MTDNTRRLKRLYDKDKAFNERYDGAFFSMSKQDAIEALTFTLFEGFDIETEEPPNPNPHQWQIDKYLRDVRNILEGALQPWMYVSHRSFEYWWGRKNGIDREYWQ